jgi:hypothetical protein
VPPATPDMMTDQAAQRAVHKTYGLASQPEAVSAFVARREATRRRAAFVQTARRRTVHTTPADTEAATLALEAGRTRVRTSSRPHRCGARRRRVAVTRYRRAARSSAGGDDGGSGPDSSDGPGARS